MSKPSSELYEIAIEGRVIVSRLRGDWDEATAMAFFAAVRDLVESLPAGQPWATLTNFSQWGQVDDEAIRAGTQVVAFCDQAGRAHSATVIGSLETGEQMLKGQLIDPSRPARHFPTEERARTWLAGFGYFPDRAARAGTK